MESRRISLEPGDVLQILDDHANRVTDGYIRDASDEASRTNSAAVVIGGSRPSMYASVAIAYLDGQPRVVKNRRGLTDRPAPGPTARCG